MRNELIRRVISYHHFHHSKDACGRWTLQAASAAFCAQGMSLLEGALNADALGAALRRIAARHEIYRTTLADYINLRVIKRSSPIITIML